MARASSTRSTRASGSGGGGGATNGSRRSSGKQGNLKMDYSKDTIESSKSSDLDLKNKKLKRGNTLESSESSDNDDGVDQAEKEMISRLLYQRAYHLPGNTYFQDMWQHFSNNHPILGICCHHKYHPISWKLRIVNLLGSILFGLAVTNIVYLTFVFVSTSSKEDTDSGGTEAGDNGKLSFDKEYYSIHTNVTRTGLNDDIDDMVSTISVTNGNIVLWTIGAMAHGLFDNVIWTLGTCRCRGRRRDNDKSTTNMNTSSSTASVTGTLLIMFSVIIVLAIATFAAMLRAAIEEMEHREVASILESHTQVQSQLEGVVHHQKSFQEYQFIVSYLVELVLTYVLYYPLEGIILFSGIISCGIFGRLAITGGRPYEIKQLKEQRRQQQRQEEDDDIEKQGIEVEWTGKNRSVRNSITTAPTPRSQPSRKSSTTSSRRSQQQRPMGRYVDDGGPGCSDDSDRCYSTKSMSAF